MSNKFGTIHHIAQSMNGMVILNSSPEEISSVCRDSRQATRRDLFFCLIGEKEDGHRYIPQAIAGGCRSFVVSQREQIDCFKDIQANVILVKDTSLALGAMAKDYLKQQKIPVIGITGSTGKTGTKDMVAGVLSQKFTVGKTQGNYNNHIGLPLTVLSFSPEVEIAVLEMGMDKMGEIDYLAQIAQPVVGVITNIGTAHLEHLKTRENIFRSKMEITNYFKGDETLIFCSESDFLRKENMSIKGKTFSCGRHNNDDIILGDVKEDSERGISFTLESQGHREEVSLGLLGKHHSYNGALAVAVGLARGLTLKEAVHGLKKTCFTQGRMTRSKENTITLLDDCYNAGPDSMASAVESLSAFSQKRKVAILGDMCELGEEEIDFHRQVGQWAKEKKIDLVIAIGSLARYIAEGAGSVGVHFSEKKKFLNVIEDYIREDDVILVKGSRKMALEDVVERIKQLDRSNL